MKKPANWQPVVGDLVYDKLYQQATEIYDIRQKIDCLVYRIDGPEKGETTFATLLHLFPFSEFIKGQP